MVCLLGAYMLSFKTLCEEERSRKPLYLTAICTANKGGLSSCAVLARYHPLHLSLEMLGSVPVISATILFYWSGAISQAIPT